MIAGMERPLKAVAVNCAIGEAGDRTPPATPGSTVAEVLKAISPGDADWIDAHIPEGLELNFKDDHTVLVDKITSYLAVLAEFGVETEHIEAEDYGIGILDPHAGNRSVFPAWEPVRMKIASADILLLATPIVRDGTIWQGRPSLATYQLLDCLRNNARGMDYPAFSNKVATVLLAGNEDRAEDCCGKGLERLNRLGFCVARSAALHFDLESDERGPRELRRIASDLVHLAQVLKTHPFPSLEARVR